jgi:hypothetical protein
MFSLSVAAVAGIVICNHSWFCVIADSRNWEVIDLSIKYEKTGMLWDRNKCDGAWQSVNKKNSEHFEIITLNFTVIRNILSSKP